MTTTTDSVAAAVAAAAADIIGRMTDDDIAGFDRTGQSPRAAAVLVDEWPGLDLDDVLDAMAANAEVTS